MHLNTLKRINAAVLITFATFALYTPALLAEVATAPQDASPQASPQTNSANTQPAAETSDGDEKAAKKIDRETIDRSIDEFFNAQTNKLWQYMRPVLEVRTGFKYEQWDDKNRVLREAGFKLNDARLGFRGALDGYEINDHWKLNFDYILTGIFVGSAKVADVYGSLEIYNYWFSPRLRLGVMKVPFLASEMEPDSELIFYDRPQYALPYGSSYLTNIAKIGLERHAGPSLRFGFFDNMLTLSGGAYTYLSKPKEENWETTVFAVRTEFDSKTLIHEKARIRLGGGYYKQEKMPLIFENGRYAFSSDARVDLWGAFVGAEWALQIMDDGINKDEYKRLNYKNNITRAMGYQLYAGYSFPKRWLEMAFRYQWFDPDDTNLLLPLPESANQARRWFTGVISYWPINLVRLMLQYTHKMELEAEATSEYTADELKDIDNDEVVFQLQVAL